LEREDATFPELAIHLAGSVTLMSQIVNGAVLSDSSIISAVSIGLIGIDPFTTSHVQPASYDLTLAQDVILLPKGCSLADTVETVRLPSTIRGELSGRSSVARQFVFVHAEGGYVDPGFEGTLTLELFNASDEIRSYKRGDRLVQIAFTWLDQACERSYVGRYQGQHGPTASRFEHGEL